MPIIYPRKVKCSRCGKDFVIFQGDVFINTPDELKKRFPEMFALLCEECRKEASKSTDE